MGSAGDGRGGGEHGRQGPGLDNVFVERLWRTVKYEDMYLLGYEAVPELERGLTDVTCGTTTGSGCTKALDYQTPASVYKAGRASTSSRSAATDLSPG